MARTNKPISPKPSSSQGGSKGGRPKGTPNVVTREVRAAFQQLLERNAHRLEGWLERTGREDPARACEIFARLAEFCIPKLARTEHTGEGGAPIRTRTVIEFVGGSG